MGEATHELSDTDIVRALKALADPTRFRMIQEIAAAGELSCGQLTQCFDVSQPTISHHLKLLMDAGLLIQRTEGKHHYTSVDKKLVARIAALIPSRLDTTPKRKR
jgi:ArsR family transcriptional regulator